MKKSLLSVLAFGVLIAAFGMAAEPPVEELTSAQLERLIFAPAVNCEPTVPDPGADSLRFVSACGESDCFDVNDCIAECPSGNNPACVDGVCEYDYSPPSPPSGGRCDDADCLYNSDCLSYCNTSNPQCVNNFCLP